MRCGCMNSSARLSSIKGAREHGRVESVQANPASDLLVLDTGPLVPLRFVVEQRDGTVVVDAPEGLFDP